jgi:hypothetical protein
VSCVHGSRLRNLVGFSVYAGACNATSQPPVRRTLGKFSFIRPRTSVAADSFNSYLPTGKTGLYRLRGMGSDVAILKEGTIIIYREEKTHVVMFRSEWKSP